MIYGTVYLQSKKNIRNKLILLLARDLLSLAIMTVIKKWTFNTENKQMFFSCYLLRKKLSI